MSCEREKRGFDLTSEVCGLLHLLSLDPGGQWRGKIVTAAWGGAWHTESSLLQQTEGLLVNVSAVGKNHDKADKSGIYFKRSCRWY